jgi:hypothetical protein
MPLKVADKYRTNQLSMEPGGYEVTIIHEGSDTFIYDKIKSPGSYIKGISSVSQTKPIIKILIDGEEVWNVRHDETEPWNTPAIKNIKKKI